MKNISISIITFGLLLLATFVQAQTVTNDWENPSKVDENKEAPRASFMLYNKKTEAIKDDEKSSSYYSCFLMFAFPKANFLLSKQLMSNPIFLLLIIKVIYMW